MNCFLIQLMKFFMERGMIKILAIDDNPDNLISLKALINDAFPDAIFLSELNGQKGIELAKAEDPDLVLLDVVMPGMDGFEVCKRLKLDSLLRDIPVVFLTAIKGDKVHRINALEAGAEAFLAKPIDETELIAQIRAMVKIRKANWDKQFENDRLNNLVYIRTLQLEQELEERKKTERALKENEERLDLFFKQSLSGFFFMMLDEPIEWNDTIDKEKALDYTFNHQRICKVNQAILDQYLITEDEFLNKTPNDLFAHDIKQGRAVWRDLFDHGKLHVDTDERRSDGTRMFIEGDYICFYDSQDRIVGHFGTQMDITKRKKAEEDMLIFKLCIERSFEAIFITDINGIINYTNPAFEQIYGFNSLEAIGKTPRILKSGLLSEAIYQQFWEKLLSHEFAKGELVNKTKDGRLITIDGFNCAILDSNENIIGYIGIHQDITERKRSEEQLLKLSYAVEQSPTSILLTDLVGNIDYANSKALEITGFELAEIIGKNPRIFSSGEKSKSDYKKLWDTIISGNEWRGEFHNKKKDGTFYWERASISPIINEKGIATHYLAIKEDITERKQIFEDLIIAKEHAEESDRLKTAFLANMSHEIRTPMNGILGFSQLLEEPDLSGEEQHEYIRIIQKSGARMLNTINEIIDISKIESGLMTVTISDFNINELVENVYSILKPDAIAKNLSISFCNSLPLKNAYVKTDKEKLYSILINLVKNAIKYTDQGSIEFGYKLKNSQTDSVCESVELEFYVKDTGIGVAKDRQDAIFERFIQADIVDKHARQGAGLGLSISKSYVELLGGKIWLVSEFGIGSTFHFTLPEQKLYNEKKEACNFDLTIGLEDKTLNLKLLIVEDDEASNLFISTIAKKISNNILHAKTGIEAINVCKNNQDLDLILMDIRMPEMDGYEATRQIREFNKEVIIIAQTAYGLFGDREKVVEVGCNDYISKPIKKDELLALIKKYFITC